MNAVATPSPAQLASVDAELGKLRTLLGDAEDATVDIDQIYVNKSTNTREELSYTEDSLNEMMAQIEAVGGIFNPLIIYKIPLAPETDNKPYCLLAGFRRTLALIELSSQVGKAHYGKGVKCVVVKGLRSEEAITALQLLENMGRRDLNPMEQSNGLYLLMKNGAVSQKAAADFLGISETKASNLLALQKFPNDIQKLVSSGDLGISAAREIARCPETQWKELVAYEQAHGFNPLMKKIAELNPKEEASQDSKASGDSTGNSSDQQRRTQLVKATELTESYLPFLKARVEKADKEAKVFTAADLEQAKLDAIKAVMMDPNATLNKEIQPFLQEQIKAKEQAEATQKSVQARDEFLRDLVTEVLEVHKKGNEPDPNNKDKAFSLGQAFAAVVKRVGEVHADPAKAEDVKKWGFTPELKDGKLDLVKLNDELNAKYEVVAEEKRQSAKKRAETLAKKKEEEAKKAEAAKAAAPAADAAAAK